MDGDRGAIHELVVELQRPIYGIALRMLWTTSDAEDATQDILVRIITRLSEFGFHSTVKTWAYRIAVNHLLDVKRSPLERMRLTFEAFADDLAAGASDTGPVEAERSVLVEEVKLGCTLGMLQCLDRPHRAAYILGEIFELTAVDAAAVLGIEPPAFRKRLERARERIEVFARAHCGLVSDVSCRCNRRVTTAVQIGRVVPDSPQFASTATSVDQLRQVVRAVDDARRIVQLHRSSQPRSSDVDFASRVMESLGADVFVVTAPRSVSRSKQASRRASSGDRE